MKILFATSEAVPFIKSGGLADVAGSLTKALRARRQACRVVMPLYQDIAPELRKDINFVTSFYVPLGWRSQYCGVFETTVNNVKFYFIDNEYYFKRRGIYGFFDDGERFAFFSKAILEMLFRIDFVPDIIHCNDWQTALVPSYLNAYYRDTGTGRDIKTVFTIHNVQYQGMYSSDILHNVIGLTKLAENSLRWQEGVNFMKGALEEADALTTVSPTYADELLDPWFAHGLDPILRNKKYKLTGILNGLDNDEYDPSNDAKIFEQFTVAKPAGKAINKRQLQKSLLLKEDDEAMLIGLVTRLVSHKGMDLIQGLFPWLLEQNVQVVLLGSGDWPYEKFFRQMEESYMGQVSVSLGFDNVLAHRIYAGCDAFLMPSKAEPCGLSQMIALRYGTIPIVRHTGGLKDSITDLHGDDGNGYTFQTYSVEDMQSAIERALEDFQDKAKWAEYVKKAMKCDFSWGNSANAYIELYKGLVGE